MTDEEVHSARLTVIENSTGFDVASFNGPDGSDRKEEFLADVRMLLSMVGLDTEPAAHLMPTDTVLS